MSRGLAVFVSLLLGTSVLAQKKPDFSGVWVPGAVKSTAPAATGGSAALPPSDLTIEQTAASLSMSRTFFDTVNTQTYKLDGSESTNKSGAVTRLSHSRWDGPRLVIEGKASQITSAGYEAWTFKETYAIDGRGRLIMQSEHTTSEGKTTTRTMEYTKRTSK